MKSEVNQLTPNEQWRPVAGYEGLYEVSDMGRVKSLGRRGLDKNGRVVKKNEKILKAAQTSDGYLRVVLVDKMGAKATFYVHRVVISSFLLPHPEKVFVNHINGVKNDNRVANLEWVNRSENQIHAVKSGLQVAKNNKHPFKKWIEIIKDGICIGRHFGLRDLCEKMELDRRTVMRVLAGERIQYKGLTFRKVD